MMNWIDDPSSFVIGLCIGVAMGQGLRQAYLRLRTAWRKFREAKELENGNGQPAS
jgi:hypothetical protein